MNDTLVLKSASGYFTLELYVDSVNDLSVDASSRGEESVFFYLSPGERRKLREWLEQNQESEVAPGAGA